MDKHLKALRAVGVPYTDEMVEYAEKDAAAQATPEGRGDKDGLRDRYGEKLNIRDFDGQPYMISEMDAIIAYLQVLGTMVDFEATQQVEGDM
jgi:cytochrome c oxidase cbb3-type subunit 2